MKENSEFLQELACGRAGFFVCRVLGDRLELDIAERNLLIVRLIFAYENITPLIS